MGVAMNALSTRIFLLRALGRFQHERFEYSFRVLRFGTSALLIVMICCATSSICGDLLSARTGAEELEMLQAQSQATLKGVVQKRKEIEVRVFNQGSYRRSGVVDISGERLVSQVSDIATGAGVRIAEFVRVDDPHNATSSSIGYRITVVATFSQLRNFVVALSQETPMLGLSECTVRNANWPDFAETLEAQVLLRIAVSSRELLSP